MRIIGLTGGIACGKSTVSQYVKENEQESMRVVDCDEIAHRVCSVGWPAVAKIRAKFGAQVLVDPSCDDPNRMELDRKALGSIVFKDKQKLKELVAITGPAISKEVVKELLLNFCRGTAVVILDAPTLYEVNPLQNAVYCSGNSVRVHCYGIDKGTAKGLRGSRGCSGK